MPQLRYTVDLVDGAWEIGFDGRRFGPYSTLETAMTAAIRAAHKAEAEGHQAEVHVTSPAAESDRRGEQAAGEVVAGGGLEPPTCGL